ncbi:hypothetical protein [Conexibacter sp. CPCC 206217]|uniref:hypothetical protein n=1 Tax=Conexibacter sp. CPCC 206217 TaxID=3064574 RepID=UPI00271EDE77|nr:hypothetical protein [Conexibacter sp. CPCC 206217]MDO8212684.1 hypothetical protein [Conexibacter sp. CPCC 206217]
MPRFSRPRLLRSRAATLLSALLAAALLSAAPASAGTFAGDVVVGPLPTLKTMGNIDLAPDGSGAIVYTVDEGGVDRAFVSRTVNGGWGGPEKLDAGLPGASSQPVVSSGDGGRVAVVFANGGNIYAITKPAADRPWGGLQTIWGSGGASDPYIDLSVNRKGYIAFTAPGAGGHDVRVAYSKDAAPWTLIGSAFDANPAADAGAVNGRPRVGASADGVAVVVWGEAGAVIARRVMGTRPSPVFASATDGLQVEGVGAIGADLPEVGVQDDDSFTGVAFRAVFDVGGPPRTRVVYRRLRGSRFDGAVVSDGTPFASGQSSSNPHISNGGIGQGIVLGTSTTTNLSYAQMMRADLTPGPVVQVDSIAQSSAPTYAIPVTATPLKMLVAWQFTSPEGATDVRGRFYNGRDFETEMALSRPELGPTDGETGLDASGDDNGDIAIAYVQTTPLGRSIAVATIDQPPGRFAPRASRTKWERTETPTLIWTRSREAWGLSYRVVVDGVEVGTTTRQSMRLPAALAQGAHSWQITAVDRRAQSAVTRVGTVRVDTVAPTARVRVSGVRRTDVRQRLTLVAADAPPPPAAGAKPAQTSGVASAVLDWGDRSRRESIKAGSQHVYTRAGRYTVLVTVLDKAGNRSVTRLPLTIVKPPKPRRDARGRGGRGGDDKGAARGETGAR